MVSRPPYPLVHSGPCIVAGSASSLFDDLAATDAIYARRLPVIAVNGAAKLVAATALYSKHPQRFIERRWLEAQRFHFGSTTVHADIRATRHPCVDYWWSGLWGGGGSAWDARKLATAMGFSPVILCGCPLVAGPHVGGLSFASFMHREDVVEQFRREIEAEPEWHEGVYSCSGWTQVLLGAPPKSPV